METKKQKVDVYQKVTDLIINQMEQGTLPWQRPWNAYGLPKNYKSDKEYRGINAFLLNLFPFEYPYFLTFRQAKEYGGKVIKGSKAIPITYWNFAYYEPKTGRRVKNPSKAQIPKLEKQDRCITKHLWVSSFLIGFFAYSACLKVARSSLCSVFCVASCFFARYVVFYAPYHALFCALDAIMPGLLYRLWHKASKRFWLCILAMPL